MIELIPWAESRENSKHPRCSHISLPIIPPPIKGKNGYIKYYLKFSVSDIDLYRYVGRCSGGVRHMWMWHLRNITYFWFTDSMLAMTIRSKASLFLQTWCTPSSLTMGTFSSPLRMLQVLLRQFMEIALRMSHLY